MRLGELLIEAGVPDAHVAQALARQRTSRERLGAALVALGHVGADDIARALARQHGVPAALARHFEQRDDALVIVVPSALAIGIAAVPVAWSRSAEGRALVVCFRDPWPEHVAEVERATGHPVIAAVACESTVARELARAYAAPAAAAVPDGVPDLDAAVDVDFDFDEVSSPRLSLGLDLVELDDGRVQRDATQLLMPTRTAAPPPTSALALDLAIAGMAVADGSDRIADLAVAYARGAWRGAVVLVVREGLALGHRGFGGKLTDAALESLALPLGQPSVLASVHDARRGFAGELPRGGLAQERFVRLFADLGPRQVAVVPVAVRDRVVSLLFAIVPIAGLADSAAALTRLGVAMAEGYERLICEARAAKAGA